LNFSLGVAEVWGPRVIPDPLMHFFIHGLEQSELLDIEPAKLSPTWRNWQAEEDTIAKCLDRFLILERLVGFMESIR
jgi:hypothetical protein